MASEENEVPSAFSHPFVWLGGSPTKIDSSKKKSRVPEDLGNLAGSQKAAGSI